MRTYGTLTLERGAKECWVIQTEPHVSLRVKRLFGRAAKNGTPGHIEILATDETSLDIRWLLERYPLQMKERDRDELEFRSAAYEQRVIDVERLLSGTIEPRAFELVLPPRDYQRVAAEAALRTRGLLVADDVGLGKTVCAIAMLTEPSTRPALVVTLTHLTTQWERELHRFAPDLVVHVIKKGTPYDVAGRRQKRGKAGEGCFPDVLVTNYHKLAGWADTLAGTVRTVIFDEVQELRRGDASAKGEAAQEIAAAAQYRLGLSATPVYNYGGEFFHVMEALLPGALGSLDEFLREWCHERYDRPERASVREPVAFGSYVREAGLMIRRTRSDVSRELPEVMVIPQHVDADMEALNRVSVDVAELARVILGPASEFTKRGQAARELDWKLRQATGIAKAPYVAAFVRLLVESGERVVLYGWHREVYSIWMDLLKDLDPVMFTGSESVTQKDAARDSFIDGHAKVLVMSLRAGQGIDGLQKVSRTVVFGELDWSPGVHEQCIGRVHRDGQVDPVAVYYLLSDSGSDPVVADVLGIKKGQIEGLRDPHAPRVEAVTTKDGGIKRLAAEYLARRGEKVASE
jgi:SNF2 family DNA or RNA helicase